MALNGSSMSDVAKRAGVSIATVSRFVNSPERLREATRERVRRAIEETGYIPNLVAGGLAQGKTRLIAAMVPAFAQSILAPTFDRLTIELWKRGYHVLLGLTGQANERTDPLIAEALGRRPSGMVLTNAGISPELRKSLQMSELPVIETWYLPQNPIDMVVGFSHEAVGRAIGDYLIERGYRSCHIIGTAGPHALARRYGIIRAFLENGYPEPPIVPASSPMLYSEGVRILRDLLDAGQRPEAIICPSDYIANGVIGAALTAGLSLPDDVAVVGFGDLEFAEFLPVPLTTIAVDSGQLGGLAADMLIQSIEGRKPEQKVYDVGFTLVSRRSA